MDTKTQIVYFLGAGASAQAIPVIDGLRPRIYDLIKFLESYQVHHLNEDAIKHFPDLLKNNQDLLNHVIDELEWLYEDSEYHQTIDTFAKKLYLQDSALLFKLKRALITYFYFEQSIPFYASELNPDSESHSGTYDTILDKRYDNLIASLAFKENGQIKLKGHIKIVTWNYDLQIELALKNYIDDSINNLKEKFNIHPSAKSYVNLIVEDDQSNNNFAVYKLNGNAFLDPFLEEGLGSRKTPHDSTHLETGNLILIGNYLDTYKKVFPDYKNYIGNTGVTKIFNFAWESDGITSLKYPGHKSVLEGAKSAFRNANILIIIGYSFPFFNLEIDKQLFENCWPSQIIIQDFNPEIILERIYALVPKFKGPFSKDNPEIEITFMQPDKYFPIHPHT